MVTYTVESLCTAQPCPPRARWKVVSIHLNFLLVESQHQQPSATIIFPGPIFGFLRGSRTKHPTENNPASVLCGSGIRTKSNLSFYSTYILPPSVSFLREVSEWMKIGFSGTPRLDGKILVGTCVAYGVLLCEFLISELS